MPWAEDTAKAMGSMPLTKAMFEKSSVVHTPSRVKIRTQSAGGQPVCPLAAKLSNQPEACIPAAKDMPPPKSSKIPQSIFWASCHVRRG